MQVQLRYLLSKSFSRYCKAKQNKGAGFSDGFPSLPPGPKITNKDKLPTVMDPNKDLKYQILQMILETLQTLIQ